MNIWDVLDIEPTHDKKIIKQAYARLCKKYHPEEYPEKFKEINQAYRNALKWSNNNITTDKDIEIPREEAPFTFKVIEENDFSQFKELEYFNYIDKIKSLSLNRKRSVISLKIDEYEFSTYQSNSMFCKSFLSFIRKEKISIEMLEWLYLLSIADVNKDYPYHIEICSSLYFRIKTFYESKRFWIDQMAGINFDMRSLFKLKPSNHLSRIYRIFMRQTRSRGLTASNVRYIKIYKKYFKDMNQALLSHASKQSYPDISLKEIYLYLGNIIDNNNVTKKTDLSTVFDSQQFLYYIQNPMFCHAFIFIFFDYCLPKATVKYFKKIIKSHKSNSSYKEMAKASRYALRVNRINNRKGTYYRYNETRYKDSSKAIEISYIFVAYLNQYTIGKTSSGYMILRIVHLFATLFLLVTMFKKIEIKYPFARKKVVRLFAITSIFIINSLILFFDHKLIGNGALTYNFLIWMMFIYIFWNAFYSEYAIDRKFKISNLFKMK